MTKKAAIILIALSIGFLIAGIGTGIILEKVKEATTKDVSPEIPKKGDPPNPKTP